MTHLEKRILKYKMNQQDEWLNLHPVPQMMEVEGVLESSPAECFRVLRGFGRREFVRFSTVLPSSTEAFRRDRALMLQRVNFEPFRSLGFHQLHAER